MTAASLSASFVMALNAAFLLAHWRRKVVRPLFFMMLMAGIWAFSYGIEFLRPDIEYKLLCVKIQYFSSIWLGVLFLWFISYILGPLFIINAKLNKAFLLFPVTIISLVLTNDFHHLMWDKAFLSPLYGFNVLDFSRGIGFALTMSVGYLIFFPGFINLCIVLLKSRGLFRKQLMMIVVGITIPTVFGVIHIFMPGAAKRLDLTPASFGISGLIFLWSVFRYQMLNLVKTARQEIFENMPDPVFVMDMSYRILDANMAAENLLTTVENPNQLYLKEAMPETYEAVMDCIRQGTSEKQVSYKTGAKVQHWIATISRFGPESGDQLGWLLILRDISERKKAEDALRESGRIHRLMLEASPNPIVFYNDYGEATYLNPAFTRMFGWQLHELLGKRIDFIPGAELKRTQDAFRRTLANPEDSYHFISKRRTREGKTLDVSISSTSYPSRDEDSSSMVVNYTDISQLKKAERDLRVSKEFIRNIINSMPSVLIGVNAKISVNQWNNEAALFTGIKEDDAIGQELVKIFPGLTAFKEDIDQAILHRKMSRQEKVHLKHLENQMLIDMTVYPILTDEDPGAVIRLDDVSERVKIEQMMIQSEKMLSVGGLAAGMAHEINNPLGGILQNIQVIKDRLTKDFPANNEAAEACGLDLNKLRKYMEQRDIFMMLDLIKSSGHQASQIVRNMLSFSRESDQRKSTHFLHDIMDRTIEIISSDYDLVKKYDFKTIKIHRHYDSDSWPVPCQQGEIQQVFLNILKNGAEAMFEAGIHAPEYTIESWWDDNFSCIRITDNGPGMTEDVSKRVFEPFFTTKEVGQGTGLGLFVSYFIITRHHHGTLSVESHPEKGTAFMVKIPADEVEVAFRSAYMQ